MREGKDICGGGQEKGQSRGPGLPQSRLGASNAVAGGLRLEGQWPSATIVSICSFPGCRSPEAPQSSTLSLSFPARQVTLSVVSPSFSSESKLKRRTGSILSPMACQWADATSGSLGTSHPSPLP